MADGLLDKLPMSAKAQSALLGHLVRDPKFFLQAHNKIKSSWFQKKTHGSLYDSVVEQFERTGLVPNVTEILALNAFYNLENAEQNAIAGSLREAMANADQIRLDSLRPDLTDWMHSKILFDQMNKAANAWNKGNYRDSAQCLAEATKAYQETRFEERNICSFKNPETWLKEAEIEKVNALTTGLELLDRAILDVTDEERAALVKDGKIKKGAKIGGLQYKGTTVVLAPSNIGKTTALISMACHNIIHRDVVGGKEVVDYEHPKSVLFMSHEGAPEDLRLKMLMCALNMSRAEVFKLYRTPEGLDVIREVTDLLDQYLVYSPYNKAGMKVEDVVPIIRRLQEERVAKYGEKHGFDLLVSDYPAKLTTETNSRGHLSTRHVQEIVYEHYVQLAIECNFHSLLAIQTNREASRVNHGQYDTKNDNDHRLLTMEDVLESWGPMTSASNVITLNRSPQAEQAERMTFYVAKSRSSKTGTAVVAKTNFSNCVSHSNVLGATAYRGTMTMEAKIDSYLATFRGAHVPQEMLYADQG